jgi:hypothetical protein
MPSQTDRTNRHPSRGNGKCFDGVDPIIAKLRVVIPLEVSVSDRTVIENNVRHDSEYGLPARPQLRHTTKSTINGRL